jgi:hypothetical protein
LLIAKVFRRGALSSAGACVGAEAAEAATSNSLLGRSESAALGRLIPLRMCAESASQSEEWACPLCVDRAFSIQRLFMIFLGMRFRSALGYFEIVASPLIISVVGRVGIVGDVGDVGGDGA